ncbi:hypothetical protein Tco_1542959, partial [Tanacetum coccineum]
MLANTPRVNDSTEASRSKPRSNTKKNRILPAKKENKKEVEVRLRTNKSVWKKVNRVDSSISSKRVVINSNSESVNATPTVKHIWKPKGKLSDNSLNKTKQVWKAMGKLFANVGYQWRPTRKKFTSGKLNCGYQWRPTRKKYALGELCPLTRLPVTCCSKLDLEEEMAPVRISSGPEPIIMMSAQISSGLAPQCLKMRLLASLQAPFLKEKKGVRFIVKWINVDQL